MRCSLTRAVVRVQAVDGNSVAIWIGARPVEALCCPSQTRFQCGHTTMMLHQNAADGAEQMLCHLCVERVLS